MKLAERATRNTMKNKIGTKNDLERYLSDKIFKSSTKKLDSNDLTDFPQIDVMEIRKRITFGLMSQMEIMKFLSIKI